jgi:uncharacterized protein (DUF1501 family)
MGGAVRGGDLYGTFSDAGRQEHQQQQLRQQPRPAEQRRLLPSTSVDQYLGATLGRWFGSTAAW